MPEVVEFPQPTLADIPARLRSLAASIESGECGAVDMALVMLTSPGGQTAPALFHFGRGSALEAAGALALAPSIIYGAQR